MRLVLFDIDGTLLSTDRAGSTALLQALLEVYGTAGPISSWSFGGKTDPQIIWELMLEAGLGEAEVEAGLGRALERYLEVLRATIEPERVHLKPGIATLLRSLEQHAEVVLGLLTGNIAAGADIKLQTAGIRDHFALGAYGSDHHRRDQLPEIAVERAAELTGVAFTGKEIVIIGDTPNDVYCGRGLGVKAIAVATGPVGLAELEACGPDYAFADLSDNTAVLDAILA